MIEVIGPGFLSIIVDCGRYGHGHIGVPSSRELDRFACSMARFLLQNPEDAPVIEVMGNDLRLRFSQEVTFAITGARVKATLDDEPGARFAYPYMDQDGRGAIHLVYAWKMRRIRHVIMNEAWLLGQPREPLA